MSSTSRRLAAIAMAGAVVLAGTTAAQAAKPVHHTSGKVASGKKGATLRLVVAGQDAGSAIANLCTEVRVTSVTARQVKKSGALKDGSKTLTASRAYDAYNVTDAGTGKVTSYCDVTYSHKNFAVGKGIYYRVNVAVECTAALADACTAAMWTTGGATPLTLAVDTAYANVAATAAIDSPATPASLSFTKNKAQMQNKVTKTKRSASLSTLTYTPVA